MDDYVHTLMAYMTYLTHPTLSSTSLPTAVSHTLAALTCPAPETILVCLDALALLAKNLQDSSLQPRIQPVFQQYGKAIVSLSVNGMVSVFPEDGLGAVQEVLAATVVCAPAQEVLSWFATALEGIPGHVVPVAEKPKFMEKVQG